MTATMISTAKASILGVLVDPVGYDSAVAQVLAAAVDRRILTVSASAVHSIMEGVLNVEHKYRLNTFDLIVPDGQPVRWALNFLHRTNLAERTYGPTLTLRLCAAAEQKGLGVFFYGGTKDVLSALQTNLRRQFPNLIVSGMLPSTFGTLSIDERDAVVKRIRESHTSIVFVGLGCPRQEVWAYEYRTLLSIPIVAVGGAFGVLAGKVAQAPAWMQARGLEWAFRLCSEPRRLWRRYLLLNPTYVFLLALQATGWKRFAAEGIAPKQDVLFG
jgi:N-acetylglucosaminyldiphosphoundecaprenol N-acetyl-beta-D-mannosaminyltransferase